jgi:propionyl-CoA synthetase
MARLPQTRSGKILRGTVKKMADGKPWTMPATIEDPKVLDEISGALKAGVGRKPTGRDLACPGHPCLA